MSKIIELLKVCLDRKTYKRLRIQALRNIRMQYDNYLRNKLLSELNILEV